MKILYKALLLLVLFSSFAFSDVSGNKKHEKEKIIKKEFTVHKEATVRLKNKYGNITITTWNKNKVAIEVKITVEGNDLDAVEDKLKSITVKFNSSLNFVDAETSIENEKNNWSWWGKSKKLNFKINYTVKMPETNQAELNNRYGNIYLDKISGKTSINCDYGKINIGELKNESNYINLDYCAASTINFAESADINIDYSKLTIDASEKIKLNADYSTFSGGNIKNINFNTDYGSIRIDDATNIIGNGDYTGMRFGKVRKNLGINTDYGSVSVDDLVKGFEKVTISASYAGIKISAKKDNNFKFEIDLQYGSFKKDNDAVEIFKSEEKASKKYYEGVFGKEKSNSEVLIKSKYGSVTIQ